MILTGGGGGSGRGVSASASAASSSLCASLTRCKAFWMRTGLIDMGDSFVQDSAIGQKVGSFGQRTNASGLWLINQAHCGTQRTTRYRARGFAILSKREKIHGSEQLRLESADATASVEQPNCRHWHGRGTRHLAHNRSLNGFDTGAGRNPGASEIAAYNRTVRPDG